jgi:hypothetical protein
MKLRRSLTIDIGFIALGAVLTGLSYLVSAGSFLAASLLGGFATYLIVFDDDESERRHGAISRMFVGIVFGLFACVIYRPSLLAWFVIAAVGAILGLIGKRWPIHINAKFHHRQADASSDRGGSNAVLVIARITNLRNRWSSKCQSRLCSGL